MASKKKTEPTAGAGTAELDALMQEILAAFRDVRAAGQRTGLFQDWGSSWGILQILDAEGPITMADLARKRSVSRQYIQKIASEPIAKGWIRLDPNPADRRAPLMLITETGKRRLRSHRRRVDRALGNLARHVTADDVANASATIALVRGLLDGL
jgi:DNA-binding MarR family transcriptional regulator